ncbi:MAG: 3-deoxy-D-manno-octulosonic acid transferase [Cycloclasticus sp. symbiont of Poecilosclerida sp. M]|nr:MAG: 3-deoxy-D-manno-octulosonic acid transferase [Cycloclasticus sp. symbiont of Poecilosclerida sp. M]
MRQLYSALLYLLTPYIIVRLILRGRKAPAYLERWSERFGFYQQPQPQNVIWFHTVSVGEAEAAFPLIDAVADAYPEQEILVTTTTPTGSERVKAFLGHRVNHVYLPYDTLGAMRRFYKQFKPKIGVILETEIWPNMLYRARRRGVPTLMVNARLSEKSAERYARVASFSKSVLNSITHVCAQTQTAANRFEKLGLAAERISVLGNIKFDIDMPVSLKEQAETIRRDRFQQRPSWIASSTHEGEDKQVLAAFLTVKKKFPTSMLVLVPRHPERFDDVAKLCEQRGLSVTRRSENKSGKMTSDVFLLDSMGELKLYYATVDIAFVGGSLVPTGGHNMLEPASLAVPVLFGPHVFNFVEISDHLLHCNAAVCVNNHDELAKEIISLLERSDVRSERGSAGFQFVEKNRGAVKAVAQKIDELLGSTS